MQSLTKLPKLLCLRHLDFLKVAILKQFAKKAMTSSFPGGSSTKASTSKLLSQQNFLREIAQSVVKFFSETHLTQLHQSRGRFRRWRGGGGPSPFLFLAITCLFCNHFKEQQTVLFEVELIKSNVPFTYFYPNTIKICLTPRQLLYSSNTIFTDKMNRISNNFWSWWRHE